VSKSVANKKNCAPYDFVKVTTKIGTVYRGVIIHKNTVMIKLNCLEFQFEDSFIENNYDLLSKVRAENAKTQLGVHELFTILWYKVADIRDELHNYESVMKFRYEHIKKIEYERPSSFYKLYLEDFGIKKEVVKSFKRNPWYSEELEK
jgi:hypothetical protein